MNDVEESKAKAKSIKQK